LPKIIVSVTNDISTDQRVEKICGSLYKHGYDIVLIGRKQKNSIPLKRDYKTKRMQLLFNKSFLFYTEYNIRLFFILLFSKKDILLSNDLDTLLANFFVSRLQRKKLVYDSHELFSEVPELIDKPKVKAVWRFFENYFYPKLKNAYTVCNSISNHYLKLYGTKFSVIRNIPVYTKINTSGFPFNRNGKKIILYQGAVNVGRGLELIIDTLAFLPDYKFVIIGTGDIIHDLKKYVLKKNVADQVHFLGRIKPNELKKITPLADIGVSVEEDLGLNYKYALPNKMFDYIQAKIPILVSNLPEMKQIIIDYKVGEVIENRNPEQVALLIKKIVSKDYKTYLDKAKKELIWRYEEEKLLEIFSNIKPHKTLKK
jgi:glycosyltransferase involved in cell wall biosynthesis